MATQRRASHGLVSVIVPCMGRTAAVQRSLSAFLKHTRPPWEFIAVVRSAHDAIGAYLRGIRDARSDDVKLIVAPNVKSTRRAWQRGLRQAKGDFVALLGPRVTVTSDWLEQLVALASSDQAVGMVAPMSNTATAPQKAEILPTVSHGEGLDRFARQWREERRGRWFPVETLSGGCLLIKRGVLEASGMRKGIRAAELRSDRLSQRVIRMGFRLAVANDLYVHQESKQGVLLAETSLIDGSIVGVPARARRCRVSLTMIVRNEEANLPHCLESVSGLFDEIVVVDTGSTDRTVEIARSFGARVFDFVWVNDFAAARNAALARATGHYAFWLDADDRIEPRNRDILAALFDGLNSTNHAYVVRCACDPDPKGGGATVVDHVRLFPVREDVRWSYRVHEQILPALRPAGVQVRWTDAIVRHVGYNDSALRRRKLDRDRAILESELQERPDDPFVLFNLGAIGLDTEDPRPALAFLQRSLAGSTPNASITRKLHALIARAHQQLGETELAIAACKAGLAVDADDAELWFRMAHLHRRSGQVAEAGSCWRKVLTLRRPERFSSLDEGIYGHLTRRSLARLSEELGDRAEAALHWSAVLEECPGDAEAGKALDQLARPPSLATPKT